MRFLGHLRAVWFAIGALLPVYAVSTDSAAINTTDRVSLAFHDAPLSVILQALAQYQQLNLVVMDSVKGNLSIRLDDVPWEQALSVVLKAGQLESERQGNVMMIIPKQDIELRQRQERQQKGITDVDLVTFHRQVNYADVSELVSMLTGQKHLLSQHGSVVEDVRSNALIIRDIASVIPSINAFIDDVDRPQPQVQLTAHIVSIGHDNLAELGVRWGLGGEKDAASGGVSNHFNINLPVANPAGSIGFQVGRINGRFLGLELSAMEAENSADVIASPRLMTANKQTASIRQGTEIPYEVSSGSSGATSIEFKQAVLGLEVTPRIFPGGQLELTLHISQNTPGKSLKKGDGGEILTIDTQEIKTQVIVADGETIALGGIFQQSRLTGKEQVPVLGQIPLLGMLFQRSSNTTTKRELVVFITPTIVTALSGDKPERL